MTVHWRKSSYTGGANDEHCVELGRLSPGIGLRDSKAPDRGYFSVTEAQLGGLVARIKQLDAGS